MGLGLYRNVYKGPTRKALTAALMLTTVVGVALIGIPNGVLAQAQIQSSFSVPAGSLSQALTIFGRQAGLQVTYLASIATGKSSRGISGSATREQALAAILQDTGLVYSFPNATTVAIAQPDSGGGGTVSADGSVVLQTITVQGQGPTTEGTGSYTTPQMSTATGLPLSIRETPQSVSVITSGRISDSGMTTIEDALNRTTGISVSATGGERSNYFARGFQVDNIMIDGLPISHDSDTIGSASLSMYDRLEVVRGATGLLEGAGNPSASVNLVRKRPTAVNQVSLTGSVGTWQDYQGIFDAGGPLNDSGSLRARIVASLQDAKTFTQDYKHTRQLYYGIFEADLSKQTTVTVGGYYNSEKNPGADWNGLPTRPDGSFYDFDRSVRSSPSWTYWNKENASVFGEIKHEFDNDWVLTLKGSYLDAKLDMLGASLYRLDPTADQLTYNVGKYFYHHQQTALDANLQGGFDLFGREHEFSVGANYRRNVGDDGPGGWPSAFPYQFDPLNWQASVDVPYPEFDYMWARTSKELNYGAYGTAKFNVTDPLNILVGGRLSWSETETDFRSGTYQESTAVSSNANLTPYVAATYDLNEYLTAYGSVTEIFKPQNYRSANGGFLDPVTGRNYELGLKGEFLDGNVNASIALFQIDQTNLPQQLAATACGGLTDCYTAAGGVRSRGVELEVSGRIAEGWDVFAGYTYVDSRYVEDSTGGRAGDRYGRNKPSNLLTLSTVYRFPGDLENWRIGASVRLQSGIEGDVAGVTNAKQDAYGTLDLMAAYSPNEKTEIKLNVFNVLDQNYYSSVGYTDNANILGAPRSFKLSVTSKF